MALENGSQSIDRAARILVRLVESEEAVTLSAVMEETQLPKSTAARLLRALARNGLAQRRPNTITSIDGLLRELDDVRRRGSATTWEELEAGLCSTAAPVRGSRGTVIAAISVSAPTVRTTRERLADLTEHVVATAHALTDVITTRTHGNGEQ